ncbi:MAG TPA: c-type cytochrome biogenesis protein CcmI [Gammaproteobacteria bacterium]|nr:c-type cytochrome biogenesis protein CcmI [Gammaproteobacteria bacterium]
MIFILLAILMLAVAAACIAIPLWRNRGSVNLPVNEAGQGVYQRQLAELSRDLEAGVLAEADYQSAKRDLETERRINRVDTISVPLIARSSRILAISVTALLVVTSGLLYWRIGNWRVGIEGMDKASHVAVVDMVQQLATRLRTTDQNDLQGWMMLGHAYVLMERYQDAVAALDHARKLAGDANADVLSAYAEAVTLADPDHFMQRAAPLFENVLKLDPNDQKALWYSGLAASQRGDNKLAVKRWQLLYKQGLPEKYSTLIAQYIEQAGGTVGESAGPKTTTVIHLHVSLEAGLKSKLAPDDTIFVFARPDGVQNGPPIAVRRFHVRDLPLNITLGDQDAMVAGRNLSGFDNVQLVARISKDGSPLQKPGEPSGMATWKRGSSVKPVNIVIGAAAKPQ